jgi:hypothetical protein
MGRCGAQKHVPPCKIPKSQIDISSIALRKYVPSFNVLAQYFKQLGNGQNNSERIYAQLHLGNVRFFTSKYFETYQTYSA